MPSYNGARHIGEAIESLLSQTARAARIVCIDDASSDSTGALICHFAARGVELLHNPERCGLPANWNRAIDLVTTPYFVIAHQDDIYEPSYIDRLRALLDDHPRAFIAHCRAKYIDANSKPISHPAASFKDRFWSADEPQERTASDELRVLSRGDYIICPSVMYRTEAVRSIGKFDESYAFVPDWEYWTRGVAAGLTIVGTHDRLLRYRYHAASATREHEKSLRRFEEELALTNRIAEITGVRRGAHDAVKNTLLAEFATRLARGDRTGSRALIEFGRLRIPRFSRSTHGVLMAASLFGGRMAGTLLSLVERLYVRFARSRG